MNWIRTNDTKHKERTEWHPKWHETKNMSGLTTEIEQDWHEQNKSTTQTIFFFFFFFRAIARLRNGDRPADVLLKDVESGDRSAVTGRSIGWGFRSFGSESRSIGRRSEERCKNRAIVRQFGAIDRRCLGFPSRICAQMTLNSKNFIPNHWET